MQSEAEYGEEAGWVGSCCCERLLARHGRVSGGPGLSGFMAGGRRKFFVNCCYRLLTISPLSISFISLVISIPNVFRVLASDITLDIILPII
jgi:hypothetical protein